MGEKKLRAKLNIDRGFVKQKGCERYDKDSCLIFDLSVEESRRQAEIAAQVTPSVGAQFHAAIDNDAAAFFALILRKGGAGFVAATFKGFDALRAEIRPFLTSIGLDIESHEVVMRIYGGDEVGEAVQAALKVESVGGVETHSFTNRGLDRAARRRAEKAGKN